MSAAALYAVPPPSGLHRPQNPLELEGVVRRHLEWMELRNLTPSGIYGRRRALARLTEWAGGPILCLSEAQLRAWQPRRLRELLPQSRRTELSAVRNFYRWCVTEGYLDTDPTVRLVMPRVPRGIRRPMPDDLVKRALDGAPPDVRVALALAGFAGLRALEIARLDWSEVVLHGPEPMIRIVSGKGGHGRVVPCSSALAAALSALERRHGPVFTYRDGSSGHVPPHRVPSRVNNYLHAMGITETLHQLRHRFATAVYRACLDIVAVQGLLGHASPKTTSIYAAAMSGVATAATEAAGTLTVVP